MEHLLELASQPAAWGSVLVLTFLEIILGIDNVIFVSIVANQLPTAQQPQARRWGLILAMLFRVVLLFFIGFILSLDEPILTVPYLEHGMSIKDFILLAGGLFLMYKSVTEIHHKLEGQTEETRDVVATSLTSVMFQIAGVNLIFSIDSILAAIKLTNEIPIMMVAVVLSMVITMAFSGWVSNFVNKHPSIQLLALAFLILLGVMLVAEAFGSEVPKGYLYFGIAFSLSVELLNMRYRKKNIPVQLRGILDDAQDEQIEGFAEDGISK